MLVLPLPVWELGVDWLVLPALWPAADPEDPPALPPVWAATLKARIKTSAAIHAFFIAD